MIAFRSECTVFFFMHESKLTKNYKTENRTNTQYTPLVMIPTFWMASLCSLCLNAVIHVTAASIPSTTNRFVHGGSGLLPFSPKSNDRFDQDPTRDNRILEASEQAFTSHLVDKNGNAYEPYSLAWRYLGMYIDCDMDQVNGNEGRFLEDGGSGNCERVLLWAAVCVTTKVGRWKNVELYALNPITNALCVFLLSCFSHSLSTLTLTIKMDRLVSISLLT